MDTHMKKTVTLLGMVLVIGACSDEPDRTGLAPHPAITAASAEPEPAAKGNDMFRKIEDNLLVSPQISVADVAAAKAAGITLIINNRPDGEDPSAAQGKEIEAAARGAGITYIAIPVTHAGFSRPQIDAMQAALEKAGDGKTLAYCRSGTRSTLLWALSQAAKGESPDAIAAKAADAGYDVAPVRMMLDTLSAAARQR